MPSTATATALDLSQPSYRPTAPRHRHWHRRQPCRLRYGLITLPRHAVRPVDGLCTPSRSIRPKPRRSPSTGHTDRTSAIDQLRHRLHRVLFPHCCTARRVPRSGMPSTAAAAVVATAVDAAHDMFPAVVRACISRRGASFATETVRDLYVSCPSSTLLKLIVIRPPENANLLVRAFLPP